MILYQMVKHIWHVSSHVTKKPRIQSWTIYSSGCLCQHRCLTPSSKIFMGVPLLTAVGFVNHAWCTGHVSCCCKEVWSCLKEKALKSQAVLPWVASFSNKVSSLLNLLPFRTDSVFGTCLRKGLFPLLLLPGLPDVLQKLPVPTPTHRTLPPWLHT